MGKRITHICQRLRSSAKPADYFVAIAMVTSFLTMNTAIAFLIATSWQITSTDVASVQSSAVKRARDAYDKGQVARKVVQVGQSKL